MFFGQIEREMLSAEIYSIGQNTQLPENLHLLINREQGNHDIWESHNKTTVIPVQEIGKQGTKTNH
ncbi:hypothetical protein [Anabaena sp. CCY 9402-a]|uniref:hypothetical protein n=1 Tax=Anabaena sp. CCY 9402-a TaxID=3103867 RepID=UPI0039C5DC3C